MNARDIPSECLRDPQFVKVLTASLCSQIAELKKIHEAVDGEIEELKVKVTQGLERRKVLKQTNKELKDKKLMQDAVLESVQRDIKNREAEYELLKNGLDDESLRRKRDRAEYEKILADYAAMWAKYKAEYEEFPLAKVRAEARATVKKLKIELMVANYKKDEFIKICKKRKEIDAMRIRVAGVDVAKMVLERWKDQKYVESLQQMENNLRAELKTLDVELSRLEEELEKRTLADIETSKMPPPRLDFSFIKSSYTAARRTSRKGRANEPKSPSRDSDTASINTLMLEEMCKDTGDDKTEETPDKSNSPSDEKTAENNPPSTATVEVSEPLEPIQTDTNAPEPMNIDESIIENKLKNLGIESKNTASRNKQLDTNDSNIEDREKDNGDDGFEESLLRTSRWCEESRKELGPFLVEGRRSKSVCDWRPTDDTKDEEFKSADKKKVAKALSNHGSEMKMTSAQSDITGSKWSLCNERSMRDQSENSKENFKQSPNRVSLLGKRKYDESTAPNPDDESTSNNDKINDGQEKSNDDFTQASLVSRDDNPKVPISANGTRPKIMNIEKVNYPLHRPTGGQTATKSVVHNYASSFVSSDNFSNINEPVYLPEIPEGSIMTDFEEDLRLPSFAIAQNSPPPGSVSSFISTIVNDQLNKERGDNEADPSTDKSSVPPMDFGAFFGIQKKGQLSMF